jgi:hypothetical protein
MYCVEEAISSTNEIAASAIGFAAENKSITVNAWDNQFAEIEKIPDVAAGQAGQAPSTPTADNGHKEGGMGTISTGEPDKAPNPVKPTPAPEEKVGIWDGTYNLIGTGHSQCPNSNPGCYLVNPSYIGQETDTIFVTNDEIDLDGNRHIDSNGHSSFVFNDIIPLEYNFQFTKAGNSISLKEVYIIHYGNDDYVVSLTGSRQ